MFAILSCIVVNSSPDNQHFFKEKKGISVQKFKKITVYQKYMEF